MKNIAKDFILQRTRITVKGYQMLKKIDLFPVQAVSL